MTIRIVVDCVACFGEMLLAAYFFSAFKERRFPQKVMIGIISVLSIFYVTSIRFINVDYILFVASLLITIALAFCYKFKWYISIFLGLVISGISGLFELAIMQIVTLSGGNFNAINENIYAYICGLIASKTLTFLLIIIIRKKSHKSFQSVKGMRFGQLLFLPISTVLISIVCSNIIFITEISTVLKIFSVIALLSLIISNVLLFYIVDTQYELISTKEKLKASKTFLENQKQYYNDIFQSQQEIRSMRHDLKSIFIAILSELNKGNVSGAENMVKRKLNELEQNIDFSVQTDNVVDAVLHSKMMYAKNNDVSLTIKKSIDQQIMVDSLDMAVLIANILDNAIEAAAQVKDKREVSFSMITDNENLILLSKNSTINNIASNDGLQTTKPDKKHHGFGVLSIQTISKQYSGSHLYECNNGVFSSTTILQNKRLGI